MGISSTKGKSRSVSTLNKRIAKARKRARRVGQFARISAGARRLFATGVNPQQNYDAPVIGVGPAK